MARKIPEVSLLRGKGGPVLLNKYTIFFAGRRGCFPGLLNKEWRKPGQPSGKEPRPSPCRRKVVSCPKDEESLWRAYSTGGKRRRIIRDELRLQAQKEKKKKKAKALCWSGFVDLGGLVCI